jgi:predicted glycoside hydrolase/deacetylase ChbG (UPF0249 family)
MIRLVVNADDFGITPAITRGIVRAHMDGIVTSCSILGNSDGLVDAARGLRTAPTLGVGIHLSLTTGRPVLPADRVRSLVDGSGQFAPDARRFVVRFPRMRPEEITAELDAQIERVRAVAPVLDHLDTHQHVGLFPPIRPILRTIARRHAIAIGRQRLAPPRYWTTRPIRAIEAWAIRAASRGATRVTTWGFEETGHLEEAALLAVIARLPPGDHELLCHPGECNEPVPSHPGWRADWAGELRALTAPSVRAALDAAGVSLCRWKDILVAPLS